uniref:LY6/PLAUR domain containing 8 n=1 Tax=Rhinopithecus bieti TaxID=61621 RepID=A0A2K6KL04_RHIBE
MKGVLVAGITAVLVVAAVESLSCVQCNSWEQSCVNSTASECPSHANTSCVSSSASSSPETLIRLYQKMFCSAENCSEETQATAFTVHVSAKEHFHFVSQCCQGKECSNTSDALDPPRKNVSSNTECLACYESNGTSCRGNPWKCYEEEHCVFLVAEFENGKSCSSNSSMGLELGTCQVLVHKFWVNTEGPGEGCSCSLELVAIFAFLDQSCLSWAMLPSNSILLWLVIQSRLSKRITPLLTFTSLPGCIIL